MTSQEQYFLGLYKSTQGEQEVLAKTWMINTSFPLRYYEGNILNSLFRQQLCLTVFFAYSYKTPKKQVEVIVINVLFDADGRIAAIKVKAIPSRFFCITFVTKNLQFLSIILSLVQLVQ